MTTPQPLVSAPMDYQSSSSRLVWVLNRDVNDYSQDYRGSKLTIPKNMKKIPLRAEKGGNLMPYLEARRFITDYKDPQGFVVDKMGKPSPVFGIKALLSEELTEEEVTTILGKTSDDIKKEVVSEEKRAKRDLTKELKKRHDKVAIEETDEP